jgi:hypothetical protein
LVLSQVEQWPVDHIDWALEAWLVVAHIDLALVALLKEVLQAVHIDWALVEVLAGLFADLEVGLQLKDLERLVHQVYYTLVEH